VSLDPWNLLFLALVTSGVVAVAIFELRARTRSWRWWEPSALVCGWLAMVVAVGSSLDSVGEEGSLSAHIAQHVILGDVAAPLLLLAISPALGEVLASAYDRATDPARRRRRVLVVALSPIGAATLWALATYVWLVPPIHRLAIPAGPVHVLDHASFLVFGLLVWLAAFDFRRAASVTSWDELLAALRTADLPWWGRHVYAMATRFALLPAILLIWLAPPAAYFLSGQFPPGGLTRHEDQVQAASLMLGFEMLLFGLALILLFVFASIAEGRRREQEEQRGSSARPTFAEPDGHEQSRDE
jgi:hypothetical protein